MQTALNEHLCDKVKVDDDFDKNTKKVVRIVQTKLGFTGKDIDGEVGGKTASELGLDNPKHFEKRVAATPKNKHISYLLPERGTEFET